MWKKIILHGNMKNRKIKMSKVERFFGFCGQYKQSKNLHFCKGEA